MTYGPQGTPVTVTNDPPPPPPAPEPYVPIVPAAQQSQGVPPVAVDRPENEVRLTGSDAGLTANNDPAAVGRSIADFEAEIAALRAQQATADPMVVAAKMLLSTWENVAETAFIVSDYQRGQKAATLACVADLRKVLGQ